MMPSIESVVLVCIAGFMLSATPGPSMLYVLSNSITHDYRAGLASSAGLALGGIVHALSAAAGLASVIVYTPQLYVIVQISGATYLAYLGFCMWKTQLVCSQVAAAKTITISYSKIFFQGIFIELGNPKTILFFLAFIPSVLSSQSTQSSVQLFLLGILIPLTALPSDLLVALAGGKLAIKLKKNKNYAIWLNRLAGSFLILLAIRLVFYN